MDNPETGDVSFEAQGQRFTLRFTTAAFIALEDQIGRGMLDILDEMQSWAPKLDAKGKMVPETADETKARMGRVRLGFLRAVFWAGFHDRHPEITIEQAGDLMVFIGGMLGTLNLVARGIQAAQPKVESVPPRPPRRRPNARRTG